MSTNNRNSDRKIVEQHKAQATSDGAGVNLLRVFGGRHPEQFDPFLMLDEFGSEEASDYIGGFPSHPHRGFETITYMLQGKMEHRDHMGNVGLLKDGDLQWMTAGKGVIHSEMPQQTEGKMRGFQLWLNLPAAKKMQPARYEDIDASDIPFFELDNLNIKALAGSIQIEGKDIQGYFTVPDTDALYLDLHIGAGKEIEIPIKDGYTNLVYVYDGSVEIGNSKTISPSQTLARMEGTGNLVIKNETDQESRVLVLAGKALKEPIVQHGPFVMNTAEEINQAIRDYQNGVLTD